MLNIFPQLLSFILIVPLIIRVTLALFLFALIVSLIKNRNQISLYLRFKIIPEYLSLGLLIVTATVLGIMITVGVYTQIIAIILTILFIKMLIISWWRNFIFVYPPSTLILLTVMSVTLIISGAGKLAVDLPL